MERKNIHVYEKSTNNCMFSSVRKIYVCAMIKEKYEWSINNCMFSNVRKIYVCAMIKEKYERFTNNYV